MQIKKVAQDVLNHLVLTLVGVFSQLALTPLYIRSFGEKDYSRISIIFSLCAFILVSDYGVYQTASKQLTQIFRLHSYFSLKIWKQYSKIVASIFIVISIVLFMYFVNLYKSNPNLWSGLKFVWIIYAIFMASTTVNLIQHALLIKFQLIDHFGRGLRYLAYLKLAETMFQGIALFFKIELFLFAILTLILKLISTLLFWVLANRCLKGTKLVQVSDLNDEKLFLLKDSAGKAAFVFSNLLSFHGSLLIASLWITPQLLFSVLIARMIASPLKFIADSGIHGGLPRLTIYFEEFNKLHSNKVNVLNYLKFLLYSTSVSFLLIISTLLMGPLLWKFLSFGNARYPSALVLAFIFSTFLDSVSAVIAMLGIARSQSDKIQYFFLSSTLIALGLQFMLRNYLGAYAVPLSLAIGDLIFIFFILILFANKKVSK